MIPARPVPPAPNDPERRRRLFRQDLYLSIGLLVLVGVLIGYAVWALQGSIGSKRPASIQGGGSKVNRRRTRQAGRKRRRDRWLLLAKT